uniref:ABC transporter domain-containing protein n=1 Tax=Mucochytrium quahogii TaxID=96639 RepID=A0A7S2S464_9STRA|mmetsp:Transcript_9117/g.14820  ORF Transcript_9117/g.14820 Transcript_9117/m.14820 type:complete len:641 (-) Transcript_9117:55-1977(-)
MAAVKDSVEVSVEDVPIRDESALVRGTKRTWIECRDVDYQIKDKVILEKVNVCFPPSRLVALMGPSGSGKTTLLNVVGARACGHVTGQVLVNGIPVTRSIMKREAKLVGQADILEPVLTVKETLMYTASLALDLPKSKREARVAQVIEMLSLESCENVFVGDETRKGISGGQKKRTSIALELLSDPSCLFLDEPTSGLDSKVAEDVVDIIQTLSRRGYTVVCTIHQPSFQVFSKFDWLVMLDKGRVAFNGQVSHVSPYLATIGYPVPEFVNPADQMMVALSEEVSFENCNSYAQVFRQTKYAAISDDDIVHQRERQEDFVELNEQGGDGAAWSIQTSKRYPTPFSNQFGVIFRRAMYVTIKDKAQLRTRLAQIVFVGILVGTIFLRIPRTQSRANDKLSVCFLILLFLGMSTIMSTALTMSSEKQVLRMEHSNGYYSSVAYFSARIAVLLLFQCTYATLFGGAIYYMLGFYSPPQNFFFFIAVLILLSLITGSMGYAAGIALPTIQAAAAMVPMLVMPLAIFAGLFIPYSSIEGGFWVFMYWLSPFMYALALMIMNEFKDTSFEACTTEQIQHPQSGLCPYGPCSNDPMNPQPCPGTLMLNRLSYDTADIPRNFGVLIAMWVGFTMLGYLFILRLLRKKA